MAANANTVKVTFLGDATKLMAAAKGATGVMGKFGKMAKVAMLATGAAAVTGVGYSVKAFADFDDAMTKSLAIMGDVSDAMRGKMSKAAREVGKTTKFSAKEAADSYFFLASAGLSAEAAVAALPAVAKFAQAGMFDMALATDLATDAQSALGLASKDPAKNLANLTRVTDVFVKANTLANTSVQQISEAMTNKAGAAMRSVGMDIEAGSAVLAAFADQGVKGAEAGTQFAIVLRDLQTKALDNKEAFKKAGVAVFDAKGEFRNMADIMGDLEKALEGKTDAERKSTLATLGFSDKSMGTLQTLLGTSGAIRGYEKELRSAKGVTDEIAKKQMQSFKEQLGLLKSRLNDVAIEVGSRVVPMLLRLIDKLGQLWQQHGPAVSRAFAALAAAMAVLADKIRAGAELIIRNWDAIKTAVVVAGVVMSPVLILLALQVAALGVAATVSAAKQVAAWVATKAAAIASGAVMYATSVRIIAQWVMMGATALINGAKIAAGWLLALGPIGLGIIAFAAIAGAMVVAWKKSETFRDIVKGAMGVALLAVSGFLLGIQKMLEVLGRIPGFGWADVAAKKVASARAAVDGLRNSMAGVKDKSATITITTVRKEVMISEDRRDANRGRNRSGQRAHGGPVMAGQAYLVGEREPELFVPNQSGTVLNGRQMAAAGVGGGGMTSAQAEQLIAEMRALRADTARENDRRLTLARTGAL